MSSARSLSLLTRTGRDFFYTAFLAAIARLDKSLSPSQTLHKLQHHVYTLRDTIYLVHIVNYILWVYIMQVPSFPVKLIIPILHTTALLIPFTSQFFLPATPVFTWLITFYSSRWSPYRPPISVSLLPTLESVLYGANISDILTHYTHPMLDILAWIPYGIGHFSMPFVLAAFLWLFRQKTVLHFYTKAFGYMMLTGVVIQIIFPCAAPWYEVIYGLTPADYSMKGSPGGLVRIDNLFHSHGYTITFSNAPVIFGAFPSLHSGGATMIALTVSHFFSDWKTWVWGYAGLLWWSTMYLTHHYLIDVVSGACLAVICFYGFLPIELKGLSATQLPPNLSYPYGYAPVANGVGGGRKSPGGLGGGRSKYEVYDLENPNTRSRGSSTSSHALRTLGRNTANDRGLVAAAAAEFELASSDDDPDGGDGEMDITRNYRSPRDARFGETITSSVPSQGESGGSKGTSGGAGAGKKGHRHTASIVSLIRGEGSERSPVSNAFVFSTTSASGSRPGTPTRATYPYNPARD